MVGDAIISEAEHPKVDTCTFCDSSLQLDVKFCPFCGKKIQFESAEIFKDHQKSTEPTPVVEPQENTAKADEIPKVAQDSRDSVVAVAPEDRKDRTAEASKYPQTHTDQPAVVKSEEGESEGKHGSIPIQVSSDSKPYKRKWLAAIAILLCCLAVILVLNSVQDIKNQESKAIGTKQPSNAESVDKPVQTSGDTYIVESIYFNNPKLNNVTERRVVSVSCDKVIMTSQNIASKSKSIRTLEFTPEWNLIRTRNPDGEGVDFSPPLKYYEFPLYPGKTWKQNSVEKNVKSGATRDFTLSGVVGGWEDVSVPAGTFKGIKIVVNSELVDHATGKRSAGKDSSWYVPELHRSVKSETSSRNSEGIEERQLIQLKEYKFAKTDSYESRKVAEISTTDQEAAREITDQEAAREIKEALVKAGPQNSGMKEKVGVDSREIDLDGVFVAYENGILSDTSTGLEWKAGPDKNTIWDEARSWVESLNLGGGGWRMPTTDELKGLYTKGAGDRNMTPLLKTTGWWVWSGETHDSSDAWLFNFSRGDRYWANRSDSGYLRAFAVRSRKDG